MNPSEPTPPRPDDVGRLPGCPCGITGPHDETTPSRVVDPEADCPWHSALVVPAPNTEVAVMPNPDEACGEDR